MAFSYQMYASYDTLNQRYFDETVSKTILYNEKIRITRVFLWIKDPDPRYFPDPDPGDPKRPDPDPLHRLKLHEIPKYNLYGQSPTKIVLLNTQKHLLWGPNFWPASRTNCNKEPPSNFLDPPHGGQNSITLD